MEIFSQADELWADIEANHNNSMKVALVPTMGNLHTGHLQLVTRAHQVSDIVIASIFVNPMQFGATEDLDNYPRTLDQDIEKLSAEKVDYLFLPTVDIMYPDGLANHTAVNNQYLTNMLCGVSRPTHFQGVCTVVCKLFNLVKPDIAVFGEKDFQQLTIVKKMVADLCIPTEIISVATERAEDGLALSSRNNYLSDDERQKAPQLYAALQTASHAIMNGDRNFCRLCQLASEQLSQQGFEVDYFDIRDQHTLALLKDGSNNKEIAILAAAKLGVTRILDNLRISL